ERKSVATYHPDAEGGQAARRDGSVHVPRFGGDRASPSSPTQIGEQLSTTGSHVKNRGGASEQVRGSVPIVPWIPGPNPSRRDLVETPSPEAPRFLDAG